MRLKISSRNISHIIQSTKNNSNSGLFGNSFLKDPNGFYDLTNFVEKKSLALVNNIVRKNTSSKLSNGKTTVAMIDDLSNEICCAADLSDCVRNMHCESNYSKSAEDSMRRFTILVETLNTIPELYESLKNSLVTEKENLDGVSLRTANLLIEDFEQSGVHLKKADRNQFVNLSNSIFESGAKYVDGTNTPVEITPSEAYKFGFNFKDLTGPWGSSFDYNLRKFTFEKYFEHKDFQEHNLFKLIKSRTELANLTGFKTFAHRAQKHSILLNYGNVLSFLNGVIKTVTPKLSLEINAIRNILSLNSKNFDPKKNDVGEWDLEFAASFQRSAIFKELNENVLSNYLYINSVLSGFEMIVQKLYGLSFQILLPDANEIWPGNVIKLDVYQNECNFIGTIYLDIDSRSTKVQGDCHFTVRCSKLLDNGKFQTPIVVISLSIVPPELQKQNVSPLKVFETVKMTIQQAENFFHEMGHAIHSMLGRTRFQHVSGTRCPTDFAEVPSHLMECFFKDPKVIRQIFKDKSGRKMTVNESEALVSTRHIFENAYLLQQTLYAIFDLSLHGDYADDFINKRITSTELFNSLANTALPGFGKAHNYAYHHRISHLVTYGGKYYSYLVARSVSSLIYKNLFQKDPFNRDNGLKWATIQSHGGEYSSHYLLEKIFGSSPNIDQLTSTLVTRNNN